MDEPYGDIWLARPVPDVHRGGRSVFVQPERAAGFGSGMRLRMHHAFAGRDLSPATCEDGVRAGGRLVARGARAHWVDE
jgi:hypothetical protein